MARKQDKVENELADGRLSHNPFAALRGGSKAEADPSPAPTPDQLLPLAKDGSMNAHAKIVVSFESRGHGGKTVTRINGLDDNEAELLALAKRAKKALGTGARVLDGDILVQGKAVERVVAWLAKNGFERVVQGN